MELTGNIYKCAEMNKFEVSSTPRCLSHQEGICPRGGCYCCCHQLSKTKFRYVLKSQIIPYMLLPQGLKVDPFFYGPQHQKLQMAELMSLFQNVNYKSLESSCNYQFSGFSCVSDNEIIFFSFSKVFKNWPNLMYSSLSLSIKK